MGSESFSVSGGLARLLRRFFGPLCSMKRSYTLTAKMKMAATNAAT